MRIVIGRSVDFDRRMHARFKNKFSQLTAFDARASWPFGSTYLPAIVRRDWLCAERMILWHCGSWGNQCSDGRLGSNRRCWPPRARCGQRTDRRWSCLRCAIGVFIPIYAARGPGAVLAKAPNGGGWSDWFFDRLVPWHYQSEVDRAEHGLLDPLQPWSNRWTGWQW